MDNKFFVIGCGRWGSFITWYIDHIGLSVSLYGRESSTNMQNLIASRKNEYVTLPNSINLTTSLNDVLDYENIIISINSQGLDKLCKELHKLNITNKNIILCMKGLEISTGRRLTEIVESNIDKSNKTAIWVGPGHVQSFYKGIPNCMVIDSSNANLKNNLIEILSSKLIRFYYGTDLIGNEIGAAAKNIIGIGAGFLDGLDLSSLKGPLMTRAPREIARLIKKMGGDELTAYGLSHLGDYEATLFSKNSHNRKFGECFAKGEHFEKLAEGYFTTKAIKFLSEKYNVDLPICNAIYQILYENKNIKETLDDLFQRSIKKEFY